MTTEYSLISVHFKRLDVKDNILIHWNILPSGSPIVVKGELLDDDVEVKEEWKDERYSANRSKRLFGTVKEAMMKEHGMLPKKVSKKGRLPHMSQPIKSIEVVADTSEAELTIDVVESQIQALTLKASELKEAAVKTEEKRLQEKEEKEKGELNPFESLTVKELKGVLELRQATYPPKATKAQLIDLIQANT